jgi:hypothetical protein
VRAHASQAAGSEKWGAVFQAEGLVSKLRDKRLEMLREMGYVPSVDTRQVEIALREILRDYQAVVERYLDVVPQGMICELMNVVSAAE